NRLSISTSSFSGVVTGLIPIDENGYDLNINSISNVKTQETVFDENEAAALIELIKKNNDKITSDVRAALAKYAGEKIRRMLQANNNKPTTLWENTDGSGSE
ncbi:MAG: hypothetical protein ACJ8F7_00670, partial [Gemmataceae bacterium]